VEVLYAVCINKVISKMSKSILQKRTGKLAWDDLHTVLAVSRAGSLSGAARALDIEHSTVFRRLEDIERRLGLSLFERQRNGYLINSHGEAIAEAAQVMEEAALSAERRVSGADASLKGVVRLATSEMLGAYLMPQILKDFLTENPDIEVEMDLSNRAVDLTRREADIALRATMSPPEHLIGRKVAEINTAVYAACDLVPNGISEDSLEQLPWIGFDESLANVPQAKWMRERLPNVVPRLRMDSFLAVLRSAAAGVGAANLPCFAASQEPKLIRVSTPIDGPRMELWLLTHPDVRGNARVRALLDYLAEQVPVVLNRLVAEGACVDRTICPMKPVKKRARKKIMR
jgi:DNA-binding transcriptional LysR family regulator